MEKLETSGLRDDVISLMEPFFNSLINDEKDNVLAIYLTGSALTADYRPKYSDINSLIVVKEIKPDLLDYLADAGKKYGKKGIKAPLIMTPVYIARSLDVFPIEFLELKTIHHLVFGENQLAGLRIQKSNLRLQCERELKGVLINLRQSYIRAAGERKILNDLLMMAFASFIPVFRGLIFLQDGDLAKDKKGVLDKVRDIFNADMKPFRRILDAKISDVSLKADTAKEIFNQCYNSLENLVELVDAFEI